MKSICVNGDGTRFGIVSDKFYYLMEAEKARMMAWLADFNINSPIEKTNVFDDDDVYKTKSSFTLSDEFLEYPYENEKEIADCIYNEDGEDVTETENHIIFQLSCLERVPYVFVLMLFNFPDLCYKILEVRHILGQMGLDYNCNKDNFTFSTIICKEDILAEHYGKYEVALFEKIG